MDKKTLKAINDSADHWCRISSCRTIAALKKEGFNSSSCALCQISKADCSDCIIYERTGQAECEGTPYPAANVSLCKWIDGGEWTDKDQDNIEAEVRFLENLLPEGE